MVVTGREKRWLIGQLQRGADLPVVQVEPTGWYLDTQAAFQLPVTGFG